MTQPASFTDSKDFNPPCTRCHHEYEDHEEIDTMDPPGRTVTVCHDFSRRLAVGYFCTCSEYTDEPQEPDPDRQHEERF
mgnify:CR=1 FL=1